MRAWRPMPVMRVLYVVFFTIFLYPGFSLPAAANSDLDFTTIRLGAGDVAVLVFGGIQGDEPGGFTAACLLATHYEIESGAVWVVPNLNFPSIIKRSRGLHGDMNRKFALLDEKDPEFATVRRVQDLIRCPEVGIVLNLHDGSGYYRSSYEDKLRNPSRWGQSIIIDQDSMPGETPWGDLGQIAARVAKNVNDRLVRPLHAIHVHNTRTAEGDREMEKSLSWYAVRQGKPAFGLEASKEFPVHLRAYYHLLMVEEFLRRAGVKFGRDFELSPKGIEDAISRNLGVSFAGNRVFLPLENARTRINRLPLPVNGSRPITSKPIMAVLPCEKNNRELCIHYGNRTIALIRPEWRHFVDELDFMEAVVDGQPRQAVFGQILDVKKEVKVQPLEGFRVNAIGFTCDSKDEAGRILRRKDFDQRFSVDRAGALYRVEVYKGESFVGMFLLRFQQEKVAGKGKAAPVTPAVPGPESDLGF